MIRLSVAVAVLLAICLPGVGSADSLDLHMRNDSLRLVYEVKVNRPGLSAEFGGFYSEDSKRIDDILLLHTGLHVTGDNWSDRGTFNIKVGGRLLHSSPADYDLVALAPGMQVRFSPAHRIGLGGHLYYAPSITSFQDLDRYREYGMRLDYQLLPQSFIYLGYLFADVDLDRGPKGVKLESNFHAGVKILF